MSRGAEISECGHYRYLLWRKWTPGLQSLVWIMLNPSTADAEQDDPTIRICCGRAVHMGFGGILVANLFAWRSTSPAVMKTVADPIGPENDHYLRRIVAFNPTVIAAWGADGAHLGRDSQVVSLMTRELSTPLLALRLTKSGAPCHPLRISYNHHAFVWKRVP